MMREPEGGMHRIALDSPPVAIGRRSENEV